MNIKTPIIATFHPQAWVNDNAISVDPEGPTEWDVTDIVMAMGREKALAMKDDDYNTDDLRTAENTPQWIKDWSGPFYIKVEESIRAALADVATHSAGAMNDRELATVLAALRVYQRGGAPLLTKDLWNVATNNDAFLPMTPEEIDSLCERLNCGDAATAPYLYVGHYSHKHGDVYEVYATEEDAQAARREIALENWDNLIGEDRPEDQHELVETYWEKASERHGDGFYIDKCRAPNSAKFGPIAVIMEGGICQGVISDDGRLQRVEYLTIDYDQEGADLDEVVPVPQGDGSEEQNAVIGGGEIGRPGIDLKETFRRVDKGLSIATGDTGRAEGDTEEEEKQVRAAGWILDFDHWWTRQKRDGDPAFPPGGRVEIGCDTGKNVYLRQAAYAIAYDKGEIAQEA